MFFERKDVSNLCDFPALYAGLPLTASTEMQKKEIEPDKRIETLSRAVTLTVFELETDREKLFPAYLIANIMSPALWRWRKKRNARKPDGSLKSVKGRLRDLQRQLHHYSFTNYPNTPGGDPWGLLSFSKEEQRLGKGYIRKVKKEYDLILRYLLAENPESQFGQIVNQPYYKEGLFPRLRNETLEVMDAYEEISDDGRGSGKCAALAMLWAAALVVVGRFPPESITVVGNEAHLFIFLDIDDGHLFNNAKWFSKTRIHNTSDLSEFVKLVSTNTNTTFFYNLSGGLCDFRKHISTIPSAHLRNLLTSMNRFISIPLKHPNLDDINFSAPEKSIPDPLKFDSAEEYQRLIIELSKQTPGSIFEYSEYSFRNIFIKYPQAYFRAALRDYHAKRKAMKIESLDDAIDVVRSIDGHRSIFDDRERIALPDETLTFNTGNDRDKALLLLTLLYYSKMRSEDLCIGFSRSESYVRSENKWINVETFKTSIGEPNGLELVFNSEYADFR